MTYEKVINPGEIHEAEKRAGSARVGRRSVLNRGVREELGASGDIHKSNKET